MKEILLTSEATVKELTAISDNVESKYLLPAIREAQEIYLREIIGDALMAKLKWCIENNAFRGAFASADFNDDFETETGGNPQYKRLLGKIQYYLAYKTVAELIPKVSYKVANMGLVKTSDDNVQNATYNEIVLQRDYYVSRADYYCLLLQNFLLANRSDYPELTQQKANEIHATLKSAASCGIWLGGPRGKK